MSFCPDAALGYRREATPRVPGRGLAFDALYRVAQLPLVAPGHPLALRESPGRPYRDGRRPAVTSLVMEIDDAALDGSAGFAGLGRAMAGAPFAGKIAWPMLERRRGRLHATIVGSLSPDELASLRDPDLPGELGPIAAELRGLFSGRINLGRLYMKLYPEERAGENLVARLQRRLGRAATDLTPVGLYNLSEALDADEAEALHAIIETWGDWPLLRFTATRLALVRTKDDLALDAKRVGEVRLGAGS